MNGWRKYEWDFNGGKSAEDTALETWPKQEDSIIMDLGRDVGWINLAQNRAK